MKTKKITIASSNGAPGSLVDERTYSYGDTNWKDKLTSFEGQNITYDEIGNPINYRDGMTMTWENGKQLSSLKIGSNNINFKYDINGLRTQKDDKDYTTSYYYDSNGNLTGMRIHGNVLYFYYDSAGNVTSFSHNGSKYFYVKNIKGDVLKIIDKNGSTVATYTYDVLGKITKQTNNSVYNLAVLNPFRYRSYVYDNESGLYYLRSRYYDPITGRFLSADDTQYIHDKPLSANLYSYCYNNWVQYVDNNGCLPQITTKASIFAATTMVALYYSLKMSIDFYLKACTVTYDFVNYSNDDFYIDRIINLETYQEFLHDNLENHIHQMQIDYIRYDASVDFGKDPNKDLMLSIGACSITFSSVCRTPQNPNRFFITVTLRDIYDFDYLGDEEDKSVIVKYINNIFGYNLQKNGTIGTYVWYIKFSYELTYYCDCSYNR